MVLRCQVQHLFSAERTLQYPRSVTSVWFVSTTSQL